MPVLFINGKFTAQRTTGVQRVAHNLLGALDELFATDPAGLPWRTVLLMPPGPGAPALRSVQTERIGHRAGSLHLWEQFMLPFAARRGLLLSLAGSAPLLARRQVCLVHDAAVFDQPQAYSVAFRAWYRALFWLLPRLQARLLTVSAFSQQRLALRLGLPAARIGIVPNGAGHLQAVVADAGVLARYGLEPGRYFLAVGSANPSKNFDALRAAFARLQAGDGIKLVLVGAGNRGVFANPARQREPEQAGVVCAGALTDAALKALYEHAAGLVFPSLYEGFGLPPLEAMASGCPVAASRAAAIPEVCGDAALYFDPASVEQITAAMQRLLADAPLRDRLRRAGLERAQQFDWGRSGRALLGHLKLAFAAGGGRS